MKIQDIINPTGLHNLQKIFTRFKTIPGAAPGIDHLEELSTPPEPESIDIQCVDLRPEDVRVESMNSIQATLKKKRAPDTVFRWIIIKGIHPFIIQKLKQHFQIDTLIAEDLLNPGQHPKVEIQEKQLVLITQLLNIQDNQLKHEQTSLIHTQDTVITIQESQQDFWQPIIKRMHKPNSRFHKFGTGYLVYALLDLIVDMSFPILESRAAELAACEESILDNPSGEDQQILHHIRRDLLAIRRMLWPLREVVNNLVRDDEYQALNDIKTYLRDVYDHNLQAVDLVETYREMAGSLQDLYLSAVSNRTNEIMRVITIIGSLFIPITFLAGVYGMNFEYIPELSWKFSYAVFWSLCISITLSLLIFFYRKGWIFNRDK